MSKDISNRGVRNDYTTLDKKNRKYKKRCISAFNNNRKLFTAFYNSFPALPAYLKGQNTSFFLTTTT